MKVKWQRTWCKSRERVRNEPESSAVCRDFWSRWLKESEFEKCQGGDLVLVRRGQVLWS